MARGEIQQLTLRARQQILVAVKTLLPPEVGNNVLTSGEPDCVARELKALWSSDNRTLHRVSALLEAIEKCCSYGRGEIGSISVDAVCFDKHRE